MAVPSFFGLRGTKLGWFVTLVAGLEFLLFGYDQGVMGGLLTLHSFTSVFPTICTTKACTEGMTEAEKSHRSTIQGIVISCYNLGCFTGAILAAFMGNKLGRRRTIFIGCTLVSVGAIIKTASFGLPQFVVGRIICGTGTGINTATVPVWQAECLQPHMRGPIMAFQTSLVIAGVMLSYWLDFGMSYTEPSQSAWRFPIAFQLVFSFFIMATILFLPESPRWLMLKDKPEEAADTIAALYDTPTDDLLITDELHAIRTSVQISSKSGFKDMFVQGQLKNRTRTFIGLTVQVLSQLTGINIITYYAASIYENEIGLTPFIARILAACNSTQYFIASMFSIPLIKYFGRRPLLMFVSSGMSISMVVLAIMTKIGGTQAGIVAAVFLFVFNTFFGIAFAQLSWMVPAEIVALPIRAQANALTTCSNWITNFLIVMITPVAFTNIGWRTYIIFAVLNFVAVPIFYFFLPETYGRSLEEIDLIFTNTSHIFGAVHKSKTMERHFDKHGKLIKSVAEDVDNSAASALQRIPSKKGTEVLHVESGEGGTYKS